MSLRKTLRGKRAKITLRFENHRQVGSAPAAREDKSWQTGTRGFVRVSSTRPGKGNGVKG